MVIYLHSIQMSLVLRARSCVVHPDDLISVFTLADLRSPLAMWPFTQNALTQKVILLEGISTFAQILQV